MFETSEAHAAGRGAFPTCRTCGLALLLALGGCASMVQGTRETLLIQTETPDGNALAGAQCVLTNNLGSWKVTTPSAVTVHRSSQNLSVVCSKSGQPPGAASAQPELRDMIYGNLLFGWGPGTAMDLHNGAAYNYAPLIAVRMGMTRVVYADEDDGD